MAEPAAEGNFLLDSQGFHKLLKAGPLRAIANEGKLSQTLSEKRRGRAETEVASLSRNQAANENQLKFGARFGTARVSRAE